MINELSEPEFALLGNFKDILSRGESDIDLYVTNSKFKRKLSGEQ